MTKTYVFFILARPSIRTILENYPKSKFTETIYNSPLFRKNMGEEQKKGLHYFSAKKIVLLEIGIQNF
jgi:hypothetical protein